MYSFKQIIYIKPSVFKVALHLLETFRKYINIYFFYFNLKKYILTSLYF